MTEPLVIIDMQPHFKASKKASRHVAKEIRAAMTNEQPIVFVEYCGYGKSIRHLRRIAQEYKHVSYIEKCNDNGSREIAAHLKAEYGLEMAPLRVVGVNTAACVERTIEPLSLQGYQITVVESAVADYCLSCHKDSLKRWREPGWYNIKVEAAA